MTETTQKPLLKRRNFFASILSAAAGFLVVAPAFRSLLNATRHENRVEPKIKVTINPLAVPREKKGSASNG